MRSVGETAETIQWRRPVVLVLAIVFMIAGVMLRLSTEESSAHGSFGAGSLFRLSIAMGALWLAWPSLRRPATWLPPGMVIVILIGVGVVVAQPRLLIAALPAVGILLALSAVIRLFRS